MLKSTLLPFGITLLTVILLPQLGFCDVEGTLGNIQNALIQKILPVLAAMGLCFAGFSFISGNPSAKGHMLMAIGGAILGFAAPSVIQFAQSMVN